MFVLVVEAASVATPPVAAFLCCASKVGLLFSTKFSQPEVNSVLGFEIQGLGYSDRFFVDGDFRFVYGGWVV